MVVKCCQLIRAIVSDDDVRVEFGRAHEYACMIAEQENGLELLTTLLTGTLKGQRVIRRPTHLASGRPAVTPSSLCVLY